MLPEPLYSIAEAIESFGADEATGLEAKMLRWGRIAEQLPRDAIVGR